MLRTLCADFSNNLLAASGCHMKKKRIKLYNPDNDAIYLKNYTNKIISPYRDKIVLIENSNTEFKNSNNCEQIAKSVESEPLGETICDAQQENEEGNNFVTSFNYALKEKEKPKKSKNILHEESVFTAENCPEIPSDNQELNESILAAQQRKKKHKHKTSKRNKDMEPVFPVKNNCKKVSESVSIELYNILKAKKKHKKSNKNKSKQSVLTENKDNENANQQYAESLLDVNQAKKKYKKSKKNKEPFFRENNGDILSEGNNSGTPLNYADKTKEKLNKSKDNIDEASVFSKNSALKISNDSHQIINKSIFDVQQVKKKCEKSKKRKIVDTIFPEENCCDEVSNIKSISSESLLGKKHRKGKPKKSIKNKDKNNVEVLNEGNNFITSFSNVLQKTLEKLNKSKENMDETSNLTEKNSIVSISNDNPQFIDKSIFDVQHAKKKRKKSKKSKNIDPIFSEENNCAGVLNKKSFSRESFCNALKMKKKHKKSNKNKAKEPILTDSFCDKQHVNKKRKKLENNKNKETLEDCDIEIQSVNSEFGDSLSDLKHLKKKRKKSKRYTEKEPAFSVENSTNDILNGECHDLQHAKKKHKKSKKDKNIEPIFSEESKCAGVLNKKSFSRESFCNALQTKKKHKKSNKNKAKEPILINSICDEQHVNKKHKKLENNMNKETLKDCDIETLSVNSEIVDSLNDLKHLKKKHKKSKRCKNKEPVFLVENSSGDILNEECQPLDSFCNEQQMRHENTENNTSKEPNVSEENNVSSITSHLDGNNILPVNYSLGNQMMNNIYKSQRTSSKANEHLSSLNMIRELQNILEMSDIDDPHNDDNRISNNSNNVHSISENFHETDSFHLDFNEEPVDFEIPPLHAFETVHSLKESQKNELLSRGVPIKTGRFTHEEDKILIKNFEEFVKTHDTLDVMDIFGIGTNKRNPEITNFLKATHFYVRLGKGLDDRTLSSIYKRARLILHPYRNNDKMSQAEVEQLKYLRTSLNKKWTYLGERLEQPSDRCMQSLRWHGKNISRGAWTVEEEQMLIAAMKKVIGSSDLSSDKVKKVCWDKVSALVPSRNSTQCRMHWAYHLGWISRTERYKWSKSCSKKLVETLRRDWYVEDASKIDWFKVHESFKNVSPSPLYAQKRWLYLKSKIPNFKQKDYKTILDGLCTLYNISVNETFIAPFSSSAINRRLSQTISNMRKSLENR